MIRIDLDQAQDRFQELGREFIIFKDRIVDRNPNYCDFYLNESLLFNSVVSYFYDIERYRDFHQSKGRKKTKKYYVDDVKKSAFTTKWIVKTKPIQIVYDNKKRSPALFLALNEAFAVTVSQNFLKKRMSERLVDLLLYSLHYRPINEQGLLLCYTHFAR